MSVITGSSSDSQVVPGGTVRIFGRNLVYREPKDLHSFSELVMGLPPWTASSGTSWCTPGWTCLNEGPYPIYLEHGQRDETTIVGTLPDANNRRFWQGALPGDTYLQVLTYGGASNKYPVKFSPMPIGKSSATYTLGSSRSVIQPRKGPPKKQSDISSAPQANPTPATNPTSTAAQQLQLQGQLRILETQLAAASPADKRKLQEIIHQIQQEVLELQGGRSNQIKQ